GEVDRQRRAGAVGTDAGDRPASGDPIENAIANVEFASAAHRQVVQVIENQRLARNAVGVAVVRHFVVGILCAAGGGGVVAAARVRVLGLDQKSGREPLLNFHLQLAKEQTRTVLGVVDLAPRLIRTLGLQ